MAQTTLSIRMEESLKKDFDTVCNDLGLSMTTAVIIFAKKMAREKRIPFEVSLDPFYSTSNMEALKASIIQMQESKTVEELDKLENE